MLKTLEHVFIFKPLPLQCLQKWRKTGVFSSIISEMIQKTRHFCKKVKLSAVGSLSMEETLLQSFRDDIPNVV